MRGMKDGNLSKDVYFNEVMFGLEETNFEIQVIFNKILRKIFVKGICYKIIVVT